ncbi:MAG: CofH family radical SAM protein, partial [Planctomycetota bacterium]|nr:CofH family radical SAM protein [Planctomycetota bacterium]
HIHAFSPLEIFQGANSLAMSVESFLSELKTNGLDTLPGTAAEILDDEIREIICPDKLTTQQWLDVVATAHSLGIRSSSTIMFGHVDKPINWARHLLAIRDLQCNTGGITEFVPLPFVPEKTPIFRKGLARRGPTFRETLLMHAVARLVLHPHVVNIQTSWVKMGEMGVEACLQAGANDLGGTLMNESISRAAGADHAQEMSPEELSSIAMRVGRRTQQRNTMYGWIDPGWTSPKGLTASSAPICN